MLISPAVGASSDTSPLQRAVKIATIDDPALDEISGIFASRKNNDLLWVVNDSGNPPVIYGISSTTGRRLGEYRIEGIDNVDWEDLAGFRHKGADFLIIGDMGDNRARRKFCTLYAVKEPDVTSSGTTGSLKVHWRMRFKYADGPRDCESVAVDEAAQRILLLSKREKIPTLYELPLAFPPRNTIHTAAPVAKIKTIPRPTAMDLKELYGKYRSQPTSMDIFGRTLVILTYKHAYLFRREPGKTWDDVFQTAPEQVHLPFPNTGELVQREALCIDRGYGRIIVTTEQLPAPVYAVEFHE